MKHLILSILFVIPLFAKDVGQIKGRISHAVTGKAISGAQVTILSSKLKTTSNSRGDYKLSNVPVGQWVLQVSQKGYMSQQVRVSIKKGKTVRLNVALKPAGKTLSKPSKKKTPAPNDVVVIAPEKKSKVRDSKTVRSHELVVGALKEPVQEKTEASTSKRTPARPEPEPETKTNKPEVPPSKASDPDPDSGPKLLEFHSMLSESESPSPEESMVRIPASRKKSLSSTGGLKAGFADDNQQFNYFLGFLDKFHRNVQSYPYDIRERIQLTFQDEDGRHENNLEVSIYDESGIDLLDRGITYSDGSIFLFPRELAKEESRFKVVYQQGVKSSQVMIDRQGPRKVTINTHRQK